jgi:Mrp family chromosome partitioning ATPase
MFTRRHSAAGQDSMQSGFLALALHSSSEPRVITFIAATRGEGTSTVALQFARSAREFLGSHVLLLDGTLREACHLASPPLSQISRDGLPSERAVVEGHHDVDRARLGGTCRGSFPELWRPLLTRYDLIAVDAPALEESPLGLALARYATATVVVVKAERTVRSAVLHLVTLLKQSGANLAGTVLNGQRQHVPHCLRGLQ